MQHLWRLLLAVLLLAWPLARAGHPWTWLARGGRAKAHARPYMAYLRGERGGSCGGFLVAPGWVMTAAQCLRHRPLTVILGACNMQKEEKSWQTFQVQEYHPHPEYTRRESGRDILLLQLKGNATSNSYVSAIPLQRTKPSVGTVCSVAGWDHRASAVTFHEANVTIMKWRNCLFIYPGLKSYMACASSGAEVPAEGDIGGPLVCNNKAYGIYSYPYQSDVGLYTDITSYHPWIESVMKSS